MRLPASCYRLQLSPAFTLDDACRAAPYLRDLGVGDMYLSPILAARPGSTHGYDVCDPSRVSPELGGVEALERLAAELRRLDMGIMVDVVPNHQAAHHRNPWWWDVLLHGRESAWAHAFDIEWDAPGADGRLVLPLLGSDRADAIARGELRLVEEEGEVRVGYFDGRYPVAAGTEGDDVAVVLTAQHYRLEDWRAGVPNYRRFFDIADLPAIAVEHEDVFTATHAEIVRLVRAGIVTGLRIDHIDGLRDPAEYLERLRDATGGAYVVVEKILARDESPPPEWATAGTTGYDFLALAGGLFVDPAGFARLKTLHRRLTGEPERFADIAAAAKRAALEGMLAPDLARVCRAAPVGVGPAAVRDLTVALGVYRTYIRDGESAAGPADAARLRAAGERAGGAAEALAAAIAHTPDELRPFVARWQQLTGPAAAKGVEDTALYVDAALLARNEPGCAPDWPFTGVAELHARLAERAGGHPLNATSTHDTKRSEDVRMRISALSELADDWEAAFARWHDRNAPLRRRPDAAPDANEEWMLYQTLLGAWPIDIHRVRQFVLKALREAKVHTSWATPDEAYEADVFAFAEAIMATPGFADDLAAFADRCAAIGARSSLALLVLKLAAPGVPDIYWGNEDWDLSLVDPDNRRPVDFTARAERRGSDKVAVTWAGLQLRRRDPELFARGAYVPVEVAGRHADRVVAFARVHEGRWVLAAVARLVAHLDGWAGTRLVLPDGAPERWHDALTDSAPRDLSAAALFATYPATLLTSPE